MSSYLKYLTVLALIFTVNNVQANNEEQMIDDAVAQTQKLMVNPQKRQELLSDPKAKTADQTAAATVGAENMNDIYKISAEILPVLMKEQGSPEKAAAYLEQIQRNPAEFMQNLPPDIQEKIKKLSSKVEKKDGAQLKKQAP